MTPGGIMGTKALFGLVITLGLLTLSCTKNADQGTDFGDAGGVLDPKVISDRPINRAHLIFTLKLSQPPLLEVAQRSEGKIEIPKEAIAAVEREQEAAIAALKAVSPEIQILQRYRMILNGIAVRVPGNLAKTVEKMRGVRIVEPSRVIKRPMLPQQLKLLSKVKGFKETSVSFIEATKIHELLKLADGTPVRGQNMKVGILDTGVDYTHRMLGGSGKEADFSAVNPAQPNPQFPNAKVVGGLDLVGTAYDAGSEVPARQLPVPDGNPIDEGGHGSHVAGTVAGIGDNDETYSGVAPDASIYAIKVFGADGSTADYIVIAGLEFSVDPNGDGDPSDRLDVVNMSLGSGFGQPQILYSEAIRTLTLSGMVVVASAGNAGPIDYIVGAPSTSTEALSVAASIDNMPHNWTFPAVEFQTKADPNLLVRAVEGPISKPIELAGDVTGELVYIGLGDRPLTEELKTKLNGKVALIDRGGVPFIAKLQLAKGGGAIGAVVANNVPGDPGAMGGEGTVDIPAIMIAKEVGEILKKALETDPVTIRFNTGKVIEDPRRIDTITDFSSKGPRSDDSLLKPEITAPGENIISAAMGTGHKGVAFSGTSMSGPHMAGVMALLRQYHPNLSVEELKSISMTTTKLVNDQDGKIYPLSLQGAGRIRAYEAAIAPLGSTPSSISLGNVQVGESKTIRRTVKIKNVTSSPIEVALSGRGQENLKIQASGSRTLEPGATMQVPVLFTVSVPASEQPFTELNGHIVLTSKMGEQKIPVIAIVTRISDIRPVSLKVHAASATDSAEALTELSLKNEGKQSGVALAFNLIGFDRRKPKGTITDSYRSRNCDLESAGYRIIKKMVEGKEQEMLQIAVKLFDPTTTWNYCEISVQLDANGDKLADQELVGIARSNLSGLAGREFSSLLLDAAKARAIRSKFEEDLARGEETPLSYVEAVLDVQPMRQFNHSTVAVVETPLSLLATRPNGELAIKVAALYGDTEGLEPDDFLAGQLNSWKKISSSAVASGFYDMPETLTLAAGETQVAPMTKGAGNEKLIVYMPTNSAARSVNRDSQAKEMNASFIKPVLTTSRE